jgi:hypothetical protein
VIAPSCCSIPLSYKYATLEMRPEAERLGRKQCQKGVRIDKSHGSISREPDQGGNVRFYEEETHNAGTSLSFRPDHYDRSDAPRDMVIAAEEYEQRFEIHFATLTYFSKSLLNELHRPEGDPTDVPDNVIVASRSDKTILDDVKALSKVANSGPSITIAQRRHYFAALKRIYSKLPDPMVYARDEHVLCVGIEREGRILAESMGWLPRGHNLHPHAKRVPYEEGLLVGLNDIAVTQSYAKCIIVDGAIASGATIISTIERLRPLISSFNIYSVHSPFEGLRALPRYASATGVELQIAVGHATTGINSHFYAIDPTDPAKVVVGDLGDTISDLRTTGDLPMDPSL